MATHTRDTITTPDGGTMYVDRHDWDDGHRSHPNSLPYHLVCTGRFFGSVADAQAWINAHWYDDDTEQQRQIEAAERRYITQMEYACGIRD